MKSDIGAKTWVLTLGHIPLESDGPEPECTSRDTIAILNTSDNSANIEIEIFFADRDPVGPYQITLQPRRLRAIRFNDLIDPLPIPLDEDFAAVVRSDRRVIVQCSRFDSKPRGNFTSLPTVRLD